MRVTSVPATVDFRCLDPSERWRRVGPGVRGIIAQAVTCIAPTHVYLFGSRATGTAGIVADVDLAFEPARKEAWPAFCAWVREEAPTLLDVDLVNLSTCDPSLAATIRREGVLIIAHEEGVGG